MSGKPKQLCENSRFAAPKPVQHSVQGLAPACFCVGVFTLNVTASEEGFPDKIQHASLHLNFR